MNEILLLFFGYLLIRLCFSFFKTRIPVRLISKPIPVKIEKLDNQFYLWNKDTDEFLSQGQSIDDAVKNLKLNFPDGDFVIEENQGG